MSSIKLEDYLAVEFFGEGYYSGNTQQDIMFIRKDKFTDELRDRLCEYEPTFCELDGKHSEVFGKVIIHEEVTSSTVEGSYNGDWWSVLDVLSDVVDDLETYKEDHINFEKLLSVKTIVMFNGVEL